MDNDINIALVDDENLFVNLLASFLSEIKGLSIVMKAYDGSEFIQQLKDTTVYPDVVIMDLRMKNMDGLETTKIMKTDFPDIKIITLSSNYQKSSMGYMLKAGVNAFIPKDIDPHKIVNVVKQVHENGFFFTEEQVNIMRDQISTNSPKPIKTDVESFSKRELEVLDNICQEFTNAEIAERLFITKRTVDGHRNSLLQKTGAKNAAGLIIYAFNNELVDLKKYK